MMKIFRVVPFLFLNFILVGEQGIAQGLDVASHEVSVSFDSVNQKNIFYIGGVKTPSIELLRGVTYIFDLSDETLFNHPFKFSLTKDGVHSGGAEYAESASTEGVPGTSGANLVLTVFSDAKSKIYFYCENHPGMGGDAEPVVRGESNSLFQSMFNSASAMLKVPRISIDTIPAALYSVKLQLLSDGQTFGLSEVLEGDVNERTLIDPLQSRFISKNNMLEIPKVDVEGKFYEVKLQWLNSSFSVSSAMEITSGPASATAAVTSDEDSDSDNY